MSDPPIIIFIESGAGKVALVLLLVVIVIGALVFSPDLGNTSTYTQQGVVVGKPQSPNNWALDVKVEGDDPAIRSYHVSSELYYKVPVGLPVQVRVRWGNSTGMVYERKLLVPSVENEELFRIQQDAAVGAMSGQ